MNKDYYVFSNGRIKREDNTIYFYDDQDSKKCLPIEQVDSIHLFGEIDLNTKFINYIQKFGIILNFYNYYGYYTGSFVPRESNVSGYAVVNQAKHYLDYEKRLMLAKCFVDCAVHNILKNLRRHKENVNDIIETIISERSLIPEVSRIPELMGIEGRIHKNYYKAFNSFLRDEFKFESREKRPPTDPINALISFGNSLMYTTVLGEIYKTQLDPKISFLHEPSTKRFSLSLDLAEIFKPLIVDTIIFSMINNRIITLKDFDDMDGICYLNNDGRKKFVLEFDKKLNTTVKHRSLKRNVSYKMLIRLECYKLIKHFIGDEAYKPLKAWW